MKTPGVMIDPCTLEPDGNCVHFEGENGERVSCGHWTATPRTGALTVAIWAKWAGRHLDREKCQGLISKRLGWEIGKTYFMFECDTVPGNRGSFSLRQRNGDYSVYSADNTLNPFIGQWVHLAATVDGNDVNDVNDYYPSTCRLYLNATEVTSGTFAFGTGDPNEIELTIGNVSDINEQGVESFMGDLDEAYIFNRALEPNEIAYLADTTPWDGVLQTPVPSSAELYEEEDPGSRVIDFKDFAVLVDMWLEEYMYPYEP